MTGTEPENFCLILDHGAELAMGYDVATDKVDRALQDAASWERVRHSAGYVDFRFVLPACRDDVNGQEGDPELRILVIQGGSWCGGDGSCLVQANLPAYNPETGHQEYRSIVLQFYYTELELETCGLPRPDYSECLHHTVNNVVGRALGLIPGGSPCGTSVMHDWDHGCAQDIPAWPTNEDIASVESMTPRPGAGNFFYQKNWF
jgi:hypothetical protein